MQNDSNKVIFGIATVTGKGIVFNERIYTNAQMIKSRWFELVEITGCWMIPILYNPQETDHLVLLDEGGLEVASSLEEPCEIDPAILESYYLAISSLKDRMKFKNQ